MKALLNDHPHINDPAYVKSLESLPEEQRRAYIDGDWDLYEGQFFAEWRKEKHVVLPFEIPPSWTKFRSIDVSGRNGTTSCHWYALDHDGNIWIYREHYAGGMDSDQHADRICELSGEEGYPYTVIDSSAFDKAGFPETMVEIYERHGVYGFIKSSKSRMTGWDVVHQYLRWDDKTLPRLRVFSTCTNLIRTIPSLVYDSNNVQDLDSSGEDHAADDLRYFLQTLRDFKPARPLTPAQKRINDLYGYDSININPEDL